jgi:choline dehydrogenase-like flavoprotein
MSGRFHYGSMTEHYDAIVVGSGAGGGTLAHTLALSGKRILLLVVDTSFFPSIGAVNPALTAIGQRHPGRRAPDQPDVESPVLHRR